MANRLNGDKDKQTYPYQYIKINQYIPKHKDEKTYPYQYIKIKKPIHTNP